MSQIEPHVIESSRSEAWGSRRPLSGLGMPLVLLLLIAAAIRSLFLVIDFDGLRSDPDAYDRIAMTLAQTGTLGLTGDDGRPVATAFRPPLYPAVLSLVRKVIISFSGDFLDPSGAKSVIWSRVAYGVLNLVLGVATVGFTYLAAMRWLARPPRGWRSGGWRSGVGEGEPQGVAAAHVFSVPPWHSAWPVAFAAGGLVAIDPILLQSSTRVMTETLATALAAAAVWLWARCTDALDVSGLVSGRDAAGEAIRNRPTGLWRDGVILGVVLGLAYLCRPTFLVWAVLLIGYLTLLSTGLPLRLAVVLAIVCGVFVGGWTLRNWRVIGHPIWATSHGGYTLLLANNPPLFDYVRDGAYGEAFDPEPFFAAWRRWEESDPRTKAFWESGPGSAEAIAASPDWKVRRPRRGDEVAEDRLAQEAAKGAIARDPTGFLRACLFRWTRLLGPMPQQPTPVANVGDDARSDSGKNETLGGKSGDKGKGFVGAGRLPTLAVVAVTLYYVAITLLILSGLLRIGREIITPRYAAAAALVLSLLAVHTFYWCNLRMRAPAIPVLSIVAAIGLADRVRAVRFRGPVQGVDGLGRFGQRSGSA